MPATLADRYRQMPDERLLQLALHEAAGLEPDAVKLLRAEIASRGLDLGVDRAIAAQTQELSLRDLEALVEGVRALPCPECGSTEAPLSAGYVATVFSALVITSCKKQAVVACPDCLGVEARRGALEVGDSGLVGFPVGADSDDPVHLDQPVNAPHPVQPGGNARSARGRPAQPRRVGGDDGGR